MSETYVTLHDKPRLWIMDCDADECWDDPTVYAEFTTYGAAKAAATAHRKGHRAVDAAGVTT